MSATNAISALLDAIAQRRNEISRLSADLETLERAVTVLRGERREEATVSSSITVGQSVGVMVVRGSIANAIDAILRQAAGRPMSFDEIRTRFLEMVERNEVSATTDKSLRNTIYNTADSRGWIRERNDGAVTWRIPQELPTP